jgi:hypothetical protein
VQVVQAKIEEPRALAVDYRNAERGLGSEQSGQRFQLKAWLEINLGGSEIQGQFVLLPEILRGTGEDCFASGMAAQVRGEVEDTIEVGMKRSILADSGRALQGLLNDIFGYDCLAAVGTILGRIGLEVKTEGARPLGFVRLKSR